MPNSKNKIIKFLDKANKNTYANKEAQKVEPSRLKSEDYHFEEGELIYHDTYFGGRDFIGEEIIYEKEKPIWGANYFGFIIENKVNEKEVYNFLRKALMKKYSSKIPVRGPKKFSQSNWTYKSNIKGDVSRFVGKEEIFLKGKIIYCCFIHGGFIN